MPLIWELVRRAPHYVGIGFLQLVDLCVLLEAYSKFLARKTEKELRRGLNFAPLIMAKIGLA